MKENITTAKIIKRSDVPIEISEEMDLDLKALANSRYSLWRLAKSLGVQVSYPKGLGKMRLIFPTKAGNKNQLIIETFIRTGIVPNI